MADTFFPRGVKLLHAAVEHDHAQRYEEALKLYVRALECFLAGLKCMSLFFIFI